SSQFVLYNTNQTNPPRWERYPLRGAEPDPIGPVVLVRPHIYRNRRNLCSIPTPSKPAPTPTGPTSSATPSASNLSRMRQNCALTPPPLSRIASWQPSKCLSAATTSPTSPAASASTATPFVTGSIAIRTSNIASASAVKKSG